MIWRDWFMRVPVALLFAVAALRCDLLNVAELRMNVRTQRFAGLRGPERSTALLAGSSGALAGSNGLTGVRLPRNSRTTDSLRAAPAEEFLDCLAPRSAACALLRARNHLRGPERRREGSRRGTQECVRHVFSNNLWGSFWRACSALGKMLGFGGDFQHSPLAFSPTPPHPPSRLFHRRRNRRHIPRLKPT